MGKAAEGRAGHAGGGERRALVTLSLSGALAVSRGGSLATRPVRTGIGHSASSGPLYGAGVRRVAQAQGCDQETPQQGGTVPHQTSCSPDALCPQGHHRPSLLPPGPPRAEARSSVDSI